MAFNKTILTIILVLTFFQLTCSSNVKPKNEYDGVEFVTVRDKDYISAKQRAIVLGLKKAIFKLIGETSFNHHKDTIMNLFLKYIQANKYISHYQTLSRSQLENHQWLLTLKISVNLTKVKNDLTNMKIPLLAKATGNDFISDIDLLKEVSFLVYYQEDNLNIPRPLADMAVQKINHYLAKNKLTYVHPEQIKKLKKDRLLLEETHHEGLSVVHLIAQKLHADVYIEINGVLDDGVYQDGQYISQGSISLSAFESSTAFGLGSEQKIIEEKASSLFKAQQTIIGKSSEKAIKRVLSSIIDYRKMPHTFVVIVLGKMDYDKQKLFQRALVKDSAIHSIKRISVAEGKIEYHIKYYGLNLLDILFKRLKDKDGFEGLKCKLIRQKEMTLTL